MFYLLVFQAHSAFKALLPFNPESDHGYADFTENQFVEVAHNSPTIMFYVFEIQRVARYNIFITFNLASEELKLKNFLVCIRLSVLGSKQWIHIADYRKRVYQSREVIDILQNIRNKNLTKDTPIYRPHKGEEDVPNHHVKAEVVPGSENPNMNRDANNKKQTFHGAPRPINVHAHNPDEESRTHSALSAKYANHLGASAHSTPHHSTPHNAHVHHHPVPTHSNAHSNAPSNSHSYANTPSHGNSSKSHYGQVDEVAHSGHTGHGHIDAHHDAHHDPHATQQQQHQSILDDINMDKLLHKGKPHHHTSNTVGEQNESRSRKGSLEHKHDDLADLDKMITPTHKNKHHHAHGHGHHATDVIPE
jgi:hypothetical protein